MSGTVYIYDLDQDGAEFFIRRQLAADVSESEAKRMTDRSRGRFLVVWDFDHLGRKRGKPYYCFNNESITLMALAIYSTFEKQMMGPSVSIHHRVSPDALSEVIDMIDALRELAEENASVFTTSAINDD